MSDYTNIEESMSRRQALIEQMRSQNEESKQALFQRSHPERTGWNEAEAEESEAKSSSAMWKVRLFAAMALFVVFLAMDTMGFSIGQIDSETVETSVKQTIETETVSNFVRDQISGITGL